MPYNPLQTVVDVLAVLFVLALVVPDAWATWFVSRRNLPVWALFLTVPAGAAAIWILASGFFSHLVLLPFGVEPWVWVLLIAGIILTVACIVFLVRRSRQSNRRQVV